MRSRLLVAAARKAAGSAPRLPVRDGRAFGSAAIWKGIPQSVLGFAARPSEGSSASAKWLLAAAALPAAVLASAVSTVHAAEVERTFIAIKPDGVQRGLISEIISRFERKGYKLVGIKILTPSKEFAMLHYDDLKERPFFNGLCEFLSSGPVVAMVWEGQGVVKYGRKLIGATSPHNSEPGTIRGDLAISVGRNIIHGSDGPETAKNEINLWFKPEELVDYGLISDKWLYEP